MIRNYFKIALRNIRRNATHSALNIFGMAIGMASAILILLWVQNEWSYDRFHQNANNLYRVLLNQYSEGGNVFKTALTPNALAPALKEEYPEIIRASRYEGRAMPIKKGDEIVIETGVFVDRDFLEMFNIEFFRGDIKSALSGPHNLVITEEMADKYFGDEEPLGKTLISMNFVFTITGVVKSLPHNSHIRFDCLLPFEFFTEMGANLKEWRGAQTYTYIELLDGTDEKIVDSKIKGIIQKHVANEKADVFLQNIKKIHLFSYGKYTQDISGHGNIIYIRILSLVAIFILIIACINYMNLTTAQSAMRAKEIGIRKVAGANKRKIVFQFLGESILIVLVAHAIAMIMVELLLPGFNNLIQNYQSTDLLMMNFNNSTGKRLDINYQSAGLYVGLITIVLCCGLLAGSYPALYLSSLNPLNTIKGSINKNPGKAGFRRALVTFQYTLSIMLIICTLMIGRQLKYIQNKNLGFNKENIAYFQFGMDMQREILKKDLLNNPDVVSVSIANHPYNGYGTYPSAGFYWEGKPEGNEVVFRTMVADEGYAKTFQLELVQGRFFSIEYSTDNTAIVINEKAARIMGFEDPIGQIISYGNGSKFTIIGVVKDFHFMSLHSKIEPLIMFFDRAGYNCFIRMKPDKVASTIDYVKKTFRSYNLITPLIFKFFDDDYDNLYWVEQRIGKVIGYFSFFAIVISCLGLIGLSSFMTERRTKEIGIRKANGAKSIEIFSQLSREYIVLVIISFAIASPVAWYAMHKWLQNFAYRVNIGWWVFALAGVSVLMITMLTIGLQSYKAASKNPVEALRYE